MAIRIADIPRDARPRERLERLGLAALSDLELIALVIRSGKVGGNALDTAASVLVERGGIKALSEARLEEVSRIQGIGVAKAASLLAAFELGRRARASEEQPRVIRSPKQLADLAGPYFSDPNREQVVAIVLGAGNRLIRVEEVSRGGSNSCPIPTREILAAVLRVDGVAFAIVHNHPSGELRPSTEDVRSTKSVADAAGLVGVRFLDHLTVAGARWLSLREAGYLPLGSRHDSEAPA